MELDDLKETWQQTSINKKTNLDIMDLIQHKSYGPVAALKRGYKKQIIFMAMLPAILVLTNMDNVAGVFRSVMFWSYVAFCIGIIIFASNNYRIAQKMEGMDAMVKSNLEQQTQILQGRMNQIIIGLRLVLIYFIILTEVMPYFQHYRTLAYWHSLSPLIRFGAYTTLLVAQYFLSRKIIQRKFGQHIDYLRQLVREMQ